MEKIEGLVAAWYRDTLADTVSRAETAAAQQIEHAVAALHEALGKADPAAPHETIAQWFAEHFHKPPISHDTELHNALHGAVGELVRQLPPAS